MTSHAEKRTFFAATALKVLLVDDDPLFRSRMQRAASARGIALTAYAHLTDLNATTAAKDFDVIVLNYFLDEIRHREAGDAAKALSKMPVVLVSNTNAVVGDETLWPAAVREFARKAAGCDAILDAASRVHGGEHDGQVPSLLGRLKTALKR